VDLSFAENAPAGQFKAQDVLSKKLVINPQVGVEFLSRLSAMNIHRAALFPDLKGYAEFIENSLLLYGKDQQLERYLDFESLERLGWLG